MPDISGNKDQHLKYLQESLHEDEQSIQKIEGITEEVVKNGFHRPRLKINYWKTCTE